MIRGITVDDLSSKVDNNNISFKAKPLPRSKSPQLTEELPQNILNNNPQSLIREMTTLNVVSGRKISSVATATVIVPEEGEINHEDQLCHQRQMLLEN